MAALYGGNGQDYTPYGPSVDPTLASYLNRPQTTGMRPGGYGSNGPVTQPPSTGDGSGTGTSPQPGGTGSTWGTPQPTPPGATPPGPPKSPTKNPDGSQSGQIDFGPMDLSKIDQSKAFSGLGTPDLFDHTQVQKLQQNLQGMGYVAQLGPADEYGRIDSMYINGQFARIFDSTGHWELMPSTGFSAWGDGGPGGGGGAGGAGGGGGAVDLTGAINAADMSKSAYAGQAQSFLDNLLARSNESLKVNPQDPIVKAQTDAYAASGERQLRNYMSAQAEKGGPGANLEAVNRSANENLAQADASFTGQVLQQELTSRRLEVYQALSLYGSTLDSQQKMALQEELAKLDAAISQAQLQQGAYQFDANRQDKLAGF